MTDRSKLNVIVEFYAQDHGGRQLMPNLYSGFYRPHLVVNGDRAQTYLGVVFSNGPETFSASEEVRASIELIYEKVDYSPLKRGTSFEIKEGAHTVGEGMVL